jgi:serine/threonine protein kinase
VPVFLNGDFEQGKILHIEPDWTFHDFLHAASQRLNLVPTAKRVFSVDGVEIDDCMMVEDSDMLFFSHGEDFVSSNINSSLDKGSNGYEDSSIDPVVGSYKVTNFLGRGGFGEVRIGEHQLTGEKVALKFLRKAEIVSINAAERTTTEIQCLTALKHQNIIRLQQVIFFYYFYLLN